MVLVSISSILGLYIPYYRSLCSLNQSFQIVKDGKVLYYVNGADVQESNWMRFVNCSRVEEEQNLIAYQYRGEIFYRAYKDIQAGSELLVWYGEAYATHLGINLDGTTSDGTTSVDGGEVEVIGAVCVQHGFI